MEARREPRGTVVCFLCETVSSGTPELMWNSSAETFSALEFQCCRGFSSGKPVSTGNPGAETTTLSTGTFQCQERREHWFEERSIANSSADAISPADSALEDQCGRRYICIFAEKP
ncbi:hypothetical protein Bbelb_018100 [Branchiostoma belcheri]|nr:hypothetical protein Bbelb_018100 [Branchiostoma belcheri]